MAEIEEVVEDVRRVAKKLGTDSLSRSKYLEHAQFSSNQLYDDGRTWSELCELAGISTGANNEPVPDQVYFERLVAAVKELGRYPKNTERKRYSLNFSKSRFSNLTEFIRKAVELEYVEDLTGEFSKDDAEPDQIEEPKTFLHLRNRDEPRIIPPIPFKTKRNKWERTDIDGFPYAPQDESGVVALFGILCSQGVLAWQIIDLNSSKGIDCICYDEDSLKEIHVELKFLLTKAGWNHPIDDVDYVVCWESRWPDFPKPVIELSKLIKET
jgi:hypothetical protein